MALPGRQQRQRLPLGLVLPFAFVVVVPPVPASSDPTTFYPARYYVDSPDSAGGQPLHLGPGDSSPPLMLALHASGGTITVRVVADADDTPLEGILVEAAVSRFRSVARTDADGVALLTGVPAGSAAVRSRTDDPRSENGAYAVRSLPNRVVVIDGSNADAGELRLPAAGRIRARVLRPGGGPWEGVAIIVRAPDGSYRRQALTASDGRAHFGGLEPGSYQLWADTRGTDAISEAWDGSRDTLTSSSLDVTRGGLIAGIDLTPDLGAAISGAVRNRTTNFGIPGLEVRIVPVDDPSHPFMYHTDDLGFYFGQGLPTGSYKVFVPAIHTWWPNSLTEEGAHPISVVEPEVRQGTDFLGSLPVDCELPPEGSAYVEGSIQADFTILPRALVVVWGPNDSASVTVTDGPNFRVGCLGGGSYRARLVPDGVYRTQYFSRTNDPDSAAVFTVAPRDTVRRIDFRPERSVQIQGSVSDQGSGVPLGGISVVATLRSPRLRLTDVTDANGSFRFDRLADSTGLPAGDWMLGTDSIAISRVSVTPVLSIGIVALAGERGVRIDFDLPEIALAGWSLERRSADGETVTIASDATVAEGARASGFTDVSGDPSCWYRLLARVIVNRRSLVLESAWTQTTLPPRRSAGIFPIPWDGRSDLHIPHGVRPTDPVEWFTSAGLRVARTPARGDCVRAADAPRILSGVYWLRWRDDSGLLRTGRVVLRR